MKRLATRLLFLAIGAAAGFSFGYFMGFVLLFPWSILRLIGKEP